MNYIQVGEVFLNLDLILFIESATKKDGTPTLKIHNSAGKVVYKFEGDDIETITQALKIPKKKA